MIKTTFFIKYLVTYPHVTDFDLNSYNFSSELVINSWRKHEQKSIF